MRAALAMQRWPASRIKGLPVVRIIARPSIDAVPAYFLKTWAKNFDASAFASSFAFAS